MPVNSTSKYFESAVFVLKKIMANLFACMLLFHFIIACTVEQASAHFSY